MGQKIFYSIFGFVFITMTFVLLYFGSPGNPKVVTLIELNNQEIETISSTISSEEIIQNESNRLDFSFKDC